MTPHDLLAGLLLLGQLTSWWSIRERLAALSAEFREFKAATNRRLNRVEIRGPRIETPGSHAELRGSPAE